MTVDDCSVDTLPGRAMGDSIAGNLDSSRELRILMSRSAVRLSRKGPADAPQCACLTRTPPCAAAIHRIAMHEGHQE